ncbi:hypothetical protein [Streptomyces sp. NPDC016172]|uniref:hypothetical protein n=1 Tax=Streptomyces sp. NPDC016172 TaxID=3364964 RepID=UPI003702F1F6
MRGTTVSDDGGGAGTGGTVVAGGGTAPADSDGTGPAGLDGPGPAGLDGTGPAGLDGTGSARSDGTGLTGLTERLAAAGGSLTAGARARGGFDVTAELPLDAEDARPAGTGRFRSDADVYVGR